MWSPQPKTQRRVKTLRYSPCNDTPNAATVTVTTCGVSLLSSKNIFVCFHTPHCGPWPLRYPTCCYIRYSYGGGIGSRLSFKTSFDSKQPKLEPKLVSALSETKCLFRLFRFYTETASFGVSIEPKHTEDQPKQTETDGNESINE
jgi:hypothetical protein